MMATAVGGINFTVGYFFHGGIVLH